MDELQPLREHEPEYRPPLRQKKNVTLVALTLGLVGAAGCLWKFSPMGKTLQLRGFVGKQAVFPAVYTEYGGQPQPGCITTEPPTTPCPETLPATLPVTTPCPETLPATLPVTTPCPETLPATLPVTTPCPEQLELIPKEDPAAVVGHMEMKESYEITWANDDDEVDVFWLMSPLLKEKLGSTAAYFGLYHVGVGFKNKRTDVDVVVQFYAKNFGVNLILPTAESTTAKIEWDTAAVLSFEEGEMDTGYWIQRSKVATIKGSHFNEFLKWVEGPVSKYTNYFMFHLAPLNEQVVQPHLPAVDSVSDFPPGAVTCADVAAEMLAGIKDIAGPEVFNGDCVGITRDDVYLWVKPGTTPRKMDISPGSEDSQKVLDYFNDLRSVLDSKKDMESYPLKTVATDLVGHLQQEMRTYGIYVDAHWDYWEYETADDWGTYRESKDVMYFEGYE